MLELFNKKTSNRDTFFLFMIKHRLCVNCNTAFYIKRMELVIPDIRPRKCFFIPLFLLRNLGWSPQLKKNFLQIQLQPHQTNMPTHDISSKQSSKTSHINIYHVWLQLPVGHLKKIYKVPIPFFFFFILCTSTLFYITFYLLLTWLRCQAFQ